MTHEVILNTAIPAPLLDIDKVLFIDRPMPARCKLERRIVANLINHLQANGFRVRSVYDEEEIILVDGDGAAGMKEAMELVFNLDLSAIQVIRADAVDLEAWHDITIILGNGVDCIADWNYFKDDRDGFNVTVDAFKADDFE